jgi:restriction system protein
MNPPDRDAPNNGRRRLRPAGGYRKLRSFQAATLIYDGTVSFCKRFVDGRSRTHDQMVQAARSGRQNIAEGNRAGAGSSTTELRLTNVARASLEELLLDYEDYLRHNDLPLWEPEGREAQAVRALGKAGDRKNGTDLTDPADRGARARYAHYRRYLEHPEATVVANALICLIYQANYLLDQQLAELEQSFIEGGGYSEQLAAARLAERRRGDRTDRSNRTDPGDRALPDCPQCGKPMAVRTVRQGQKKGAQFLGCTGYPECRGALPLEGDSRRDRSDRSDRTDPTDHR